jgi:hypothetical protein
MSKSLAGLSLSGLPFVSNVTWGRETHKKTRDKARCARTWIYLSIEQLPSTRKGISIYCEGWSSARKGKNMSLGVLSSARPSNYLHVEGAARARDATSQRSAPRGALGRRFTFLAKRFRALGRAPIRMSIVNRVLATHPT